MFKKESLKFLFIICAFILTLSTWGVVFIDGTISITPNNIPTRGYAIQAISIFGNQVEVPTLPVFYNVVHVTSNVSLAAYQNTIIVDSPTDGKTITLLSSSDPSVVPGLPYKFIIMDGAVTSNTIGVTPGDFLNGVEDGTYVLNARVSGIVSLTLISDSVGWFAVP